MNAKYEDRIRELERQLVDNKLKERQREADEKTKLADAEKRLEQEKLKFLGETIGATGELIEQAIGARKEFGALLKILALGEVAVNLFRELSANAVAAAQNPLNAVTFGAAGSAQLTRSNILSFLRAGIATTNILAQQFQEGGIIEGRSHREGGVPARLANGGMVELEGGEAIINKKSTALFRDRLSEINSFGGYGRKFQFGGIPQVTTSDTGLADVLNQLRRIDINPVVSVVEIDRVQTNVSVIETANRL